MTSQPLSQIKFVLVITRVVNFADIIKIATMYIKTTFKDSKKVEKNLEIIH